MEETRSNWPYNEYDDLVCSVCRKQAKRTDCELLEGTILEVLEVVLINLNLTTIQPVICKDCNEKLLDVFQHKSKWIYTEDRLFPYINSAIDGKVDITTAYLNENDCKLLDIKTDIQICRLCMELINNNSWNMLFEVLEKQYSVEMFEKYVPELNLNAIENPIVCKSCLDSMSVFMGFIAFYESKEMKTEDYFEADVESKPCGINSEMVEDLKQNNGENNSKCQKILKRPKCIHVSKDKPHLLKHALIHKAKKQAKLFNCKICSYRSSFKVNLENHFLTHSTQRLKCITCDFRINNKSDLKKHEMRHKRAFFQRKYKSSLQKHILIHKPLSEVEVFKCEFCTFETNRKIFLQKHILIHKPLSEVKVFKCEFCSFETKYKINLRQHILIHKPLSEVEVFKCEFCTYETNHKGNLRRHILIHKPLSEVELFKCELCSFETKYKKSLQNHLLIHKLLSEVEVFKCNFCTFKTKHKVSLRNHILIHKPLSGVKVFKCEFCSFETKRKGSLRRHILIHKPLSEVELFKCEFCSYETKLKANLRRHILIHKPRPEVELVKCELCSFETKHKENLRRHLLIHKPLSEVEVFKCKFCTFETNYKGSLRHHVSKCSNVKVIILKRN